MYTLYIGNKNYSSWSLRGWLTMKLSGAPFKEVLVQLQGVGPNSAHMAYSPSGYVPALHDDDLVVTVCDMAREALGGQAAVHWSVPDPVPAGDPASFDAAVADLSYRVGHLAPRLAASS